MNNMTISVSCQSGLEKTVKRELYGLGVSGDLPAINGRIAFEGDCQTLARCNMFLRTADRVYIEVTKFKAVSFDELFDGVASYEWENIFPKNAKIVVTGKSQKSIIFGVSASQSIIKKAIVVRLMKAYNIASLEESGATFNIEFSFFEDIVTFSLNTSGVGLTKRGYRKFVGEAPIKETLASAIIDMSYWKSFRPFLDPFAGSGTFAIEACLKGLNIASGKLRDFDFKYWNDEYKNAYNLAYEEALATEKLDTKLDIQGYDIDESQTSLANIHAKNAGVEKNVIFHTMDMREIKRYDSYGVLVTNPPYGERIGDLKNLDKLYTDFGKMAKELDNWSVFCVTALSNFEMLFGKKADKNQKLYNSNITVRLYSYYANRPTREV